MLTLDYLKTRGLKPPHEISDATLMEAMNKWEELERIAKSAPGGKLSTKGLERLDFLKQRGYPLPMHISDASLMLTSQKWEKLEKMIENSGGIRLTLENMLKMDIIHNEKKWPLPKVITNASISDTYAKRMQQSNSMITAANITKLQAMRDHGYDVGQLTNEAIEEAFTMY